MTSENVVHIRLDSNEAIMAKRAILSSEISSLRIAKTIGKHRSLRIAELDLKNKIYVKMKEAKASIRKLENLLPAPKIPRILKREHTMEEHLEKSKDITEQQGDIESQLWEIQRRLEELQA